MNQIYKNRYRIMRIIQKNTAEAEDLISREKVIMKIPDPDSVPHEIPVYPGICCLRDTITEAGMTIYVFEYIKGETLQERMKRTGVFSVSDAGRILQNLCVLLKELYAMKEKWIFGDLKPSNIMIRQDGSLCLIDAESVFPEERKKRYAAYATKGYAAPEQFGSSPDIDIRSSVYSLGSIFLEMITGRSLKDTGYVIYPAGALMPSLKGSEAEKIAAKCLRPDPDQRYQTPAELYQASDCLCGK